MDPAEPTGYENEPREQFHKLPSHLQHLFYHFERLSHDLHTEQSYYRTRLQGRCSRLLELGCGAGLLTTDLQIKGFDVIGVDIDLNALSLSPAASGCRFVQMDMCELGFQPRFEAVLAGQNTLNLLVDKDMILHCLTEIRRVLIPPGLLLVHLYCADDDRKAEPGERVLQFCLFDNPEGGKIIKETIRSFSPDQQVLLLEERYKVRHFRPDLPDINYRHHLRLAAISKSGWFELFGSAGFIVESCSSAFSESSPTAGTTLHIIARAVIR